MTAVDPTHLELMRSYAAGPWAVLRRVRIPNAVPHLFTALRIAAPAAVVTAFVSEYFGGSQDGLGYSITSNSSSSSTMRSRRTRVQRARRRAASDPGGRYWASFW